MNQREGFLKEGGGWQAGGGGGGVSYHSALFEFLMAAMQMRRAN